MIPDVFYYEGIRFDRQPQLELHSFIFSNHIYYAKWDDGADDFRVFYNFIKNDCEPEDYKYFVNTRRIRVRGIPGYGYLQDKVEYETPKNFDVELFDIQLKKLQRKYEITDFTLGHNIGFINGQPKIYDLDLE